MRIYRVLSCKLWYPLLTWRERNHLLLLLTRMGEWFGMILLVSVGNSVSSDHVKLLCNSSVRLWCHQPSGSTGEVESDWLDTDTWEDREGK